MRFHPKKGLVATALTLALGSFGTAQAADIISFDPDGTAATNGAFSVGAFDWAVASALADNSQVTGGDPTDFPLYFHAALSGFQDLNGDPAGTPTGLNTTFEITVIGGFNESITFSSPSAPTLVSDGGDGVGGGNDVYSITANGNLTSAGLDQSSSFINVYYDDFTSGQKSSSLTGLDYDDGALIMSATLFSATGTIAVTQTFIDVNNNGIFDSGVDTVQGVLLDNFGADQWGGQLTTTADGSTSLTATITFFDPNFFLTPLAQLAQDLDFTTETNLEFNQTNPSNSFDTDTTLIAANVVSTGNGLLSLGTINGGFLGGAGPDFLLQADASNSFVAAVPEPSVLGLLGLGLIGLAFSRRQTIR